MDQEIKQPNANINTNTNTDQDANVSRADSGQSPTFDQLMQKSPTLSPFCGWLKCLRAPALSMQYSIRKRHIPDLDNDTGEQGQATSPSVQKGKNSDIMDVTGDFTIRYFDLMAGAVGLLLLGCIWKGCCRLKRVMK